MEATLQSPTGQTMLEKSLVTIGHAPNNQLVVNDPNTSPYHAVLHSTEQGYTITDLGSAHGTFVNGQRLASNTHHLLHTGDQIGIGETMFTYEVQDGKAMVVEQRINPKDTPVEPPHASERTNYTTASVPPYTPPLAQPYEPVPPAEQAPPSWQEYAPVLPSPYVAPGHPETIPAYKAPPEKKGPGRWLSILLFVVAAVVALGGIGVSAFLYLHPPLQPVINVTSDYKVGSTPAGAIGTAFHVSGQQFTNNSNVTFLLDGTPISNQRVVQSDSNGNIKTDLAVTGAWTVGKHTLTARDTQNNVTKAGLNVVIVPQGQANTPGPNGAPPDDMSFAMKVTIQRQYAQTGEQLEPWVESILVTGRPDPAGGSVYQERDNGQPLTVSGDLGNGLTYTETVVFQNSGTYKAGKLSYTETTTSDKMTVYEGGSIIATCESKSPYSWEQLEGTFSDRNTISGTYSSDSSTLVCSNGKQLTSIAETGTWTGTTVSSTTTSSISFIALDRLMLKWMKPEG
jgi:FHA domain